MKKGRSRFYRGVIGGSLKGVTPYQLKMLSCSLFPLLVPLNRNGWGIIGLSSQMEGELLKIVAWLNGIEVKVVEGDNPYRWGREVFKQGFSHLFISWSVVERLLESSRVDETFFSKVHYIGVFGEVNWEKVALFRSRFLKMVYPIGSGKGGLIWSISLPTILMDDFLIQPGWRWGSYGVLLPGIEVIKKGDNWIEVSGVGIDRERGQRGRLKLPVKLGKGLFLYP